MHFNIAQVNTQHGLRLINALLNDTLFEGVCYEYQSVKKYCWFN